MATALTLPIARLRAAGCKVSTIVGHDPKIGDFLYSVTLPKGIPGHSIRRPLATRRSSLDRPSVECS